MKSISMTASLNHVPKVHVSTKSIVTNATVSQDMVDLTAD